MNTYQCISTIKQMFQSESCSKVLPSPPPISSQSLERITFMQIQRQRLANADQSHNTKILPSPAATSPCPTTSSNISKPNRSFSLRCTHPYANRKRMSQANKSQAAASRYRRVDEDVHNEIGSFQYFPISLRVCSPFFQ